MASVLTIALIGGLALGQAPVATPTARPTPVPIAIVPAAQPKPAAPAPPASPTPTTSTDDAALDDPWEERKLRAREDVEYLEAFVRAKQAECREAEQRVATFTTWRVDQERMKQKGIVSPFQSNIAGLNMSEYQSELEMRRVEVKDAEIRLNRARRKLKLVERSGTIPPTDGESANNDDRVRELELKVERLRKEVERSSRFTETKRHAMEE